MTLSTERAENFSLPYFTHLNRRLRHGHIGEAAEIRQVGEFAGAGRLLAVAAGIDGQRIAG